MGKLPVRKSKELFVAWTKKHYPKLYKEAALTVAKDSNDSGLLGFDWLDTITDTIGSLAPQVLKFNQQKKLMDMQMDRAKAGLPPAKIDEYTPVLRVQTDLAPDTRKAVMSTTKDIMKPVIIGGLFIAGFLLLNKKRR